MPLTDTGEVTCRIMGLNSPKRLVKRQVISRAGRYPSIEALALMRE
jgi:hypothetical protein